MLEPQAASTERCCGMTEDSDETWWEEGKSDLQGVPNPEPATAQQVFVTQGAAVPVQAGASALIIIALIISVLGLACCGPLAIISLIIAQVQLSEIKNIPNHPDQKLAQATNIISIIAIAWMLIVIILEMAF